MCSSSIVLRTVDAVDYSMSYWSLYQLSVGLYKSCYMAHDDGRSRRGPPATPPFGQKYLRPEGPTSFLPRIFAEILFVPKGPKFFQARHLINRSATEYGSKSSVKSYYTHHHTGRLCCPFVSKVRYCLIHLLFCSSSTLPNKLKL